MFRSLFSKDIATWTKEGDEHRAKGGYKEALGCYNEALEINNKSVSIWNKKGWIYYCVGLYQKAIDCYDKALSLEVANRSNLYNNKGLALRAQARFDEAIVCYNEALKTDSKYASGFCSLGYIYYCQGNHEEALYYYNKAIQADSRYSLAWAYRSNLLLNQTDIAQAKLTIDEALRINKDDPYALQTLAILHLKQGQSLEAKGLLTKAEDKLTRADKSQTALASLLTMRGQLLTAINALPEAKKAFEDALKITPQYQIASLELDSVNRLISPTSARPNPPKEHITPPKSPTQNLTPSNSPFNSSEKNPSSTSSSPQSKTDSFSGNTPPIPRPQTETADSFEKRAPHYNSEPIPPMPQAESLKEPQPLSSSAPTPRRPTAKPSIGLSSELIIPGEELEYDTTKPVGKGAYGEVFKGTWQHETVAVKRLLEGHLSLEAEKELAAEAKIMTHLRSDYIVFLKGMVIDSRPYCLVMSWMDNGSLYHVLHSHKDLTLTTRRQIALDISKGLSFLHNKKILHRDLKSLNVLLDKHMQAKLADFGLSKLKTETLISSNRGIAGTPQWMAPELLDDESTSSRDSEKSDIYSYGMIVWELVTREIPYKNLKPMQVMNRVARGTREAIPADCYPPVAHLIQWCWSQEPEKRPTAKEVVHYLETATQAEPPIDNKPITTKHWRADIKEIENDTASLTSQLFEPTEEDKQKVVEYYLQCPVPGYDVKSIKVIFSSKADKEFETKLERLQKRKGNSAFEPKYTQEGQSSQEESWRNEILSRYKQLTAPYTDSDYPDVKLLPTWHGTTSEVMQSILRTGYACLANDAVDPGYFGRGIYSTCEAEYAYRVYATRNFSREGLLMLNWVAAYSPYPVIDGDMGKLVGKGSYQNYDAHFAPVKPRNPNSRLETYYYPCAPNESSQYTEIAVFESAQCLPRYLVELQTNLPKSMPASPFMEPPKQIQSLLFKPEGVKFKKVSQEANTKAEEGQEKSKHCIIG